MRKYIKRQMTELLDTMSDAVEMLDQIVESAEIQ